MGSRFLFNWQRLVCNTAAQPTQEPIHSSLHHPNPAQGLAALPPGQHPVLVCRAQPAAVRAWGMMVPFQLTVHLCVCAPARVCMPMCGRACVCLCVCWTEAPSLCRRVTLHPQLTQRASGRGSVTLGLDQLPVVFFLAPDPAPCYRVTEPRVMTVQVRGRPLAPKHRVHSLPGRSPFPA